MPGEQLRVEWWRRRPDLWIMLLLSAAVLAVYLPAVKAPWYFDDFGLIDDPVIAHFDQVWALFGTRRWLATFSFALNYRLFGLEPAAFRAINIALHLAATVLVYLLLKRMIPERRLAVAGALIFAVHPLQTQAVTYVVQRMTSQCGFFFLLALYLFVRASEDDRNGRLRRSRVAYAAALASGACALYSKEIALVLPGALWLFGRFFLPDVPSRRLLTAVLPFLLLPLWLLGEHLLLPLAAGNSLGQITHSTTQPGAGPNTPLYYLVTEFTVLWIYLRLLFIPVGQMIDYGYPVVAELWTLQNGIALIGLLSLGGLAWRLRRRRPLLAFGITWFFLTLAVESSILPLDPLFEHRLYLPLFGFAAVVADGLRGLSSPPRQRVVLVGVVVLFALLAVRRNLLWNHPVALYEDNYRRAPWHDRVRVNLSVQYLEAGELAKAEALFLEVLARKPRDDSLYASLSKIYTQRGEYERGRAILLAGLEQRPDSKDLHNNLGSLLLLLKEYDAAEEHLRQALQLDPRYSAVLTNLGLVYAGRNQWADAEGWHRRAIAARYEDPYAHYNLGLALAMQGRFAEALAVQQEAVTVAPQDPDPWTELARLALALDRRELVEPALTQLEALAPGRAVEIRRDYGLAGGAGGQP